MRLESANTWGSENVCGLTKSPKTSLLALSQNKTHTKKLINFIVYSKHRSLSYGFVGRRDENAELESSPSLSHLRADTALKHCELRDTSQSQPGSLTWGSDIYQGEDWGTHIPLNPSASCLGTRKPGGRLKLWHLPASEKYKEGFPALPWFPLFRAPWDTWEPVSKRNSLPVRSQIRFRGTLRWITGKQGAYLKITNSVEGVCPSTALVTL